MYNTARKISKPEFLTSSLRQRCSNILLVVVKVCLSSPSGAFDSFRLISLAIMLEYSASSSSVICVFLRESTLLKANRRLVFREGGPFPGNLKKKDQV